MISVVLYADFLAVFKGAGNRKWERMGETRVD